MCPLFLCELGEETPALGRARAVNLRLCGDCETPAPEGPGGYPEGWEVWGQHGRVVYRCPDCQEIRAACEELGDWQRRRPR